MQRKRIFARVFQNDGITPITEWSNFQFGGYTKELNAGPGEALIKLALPFDYDGTDINEGNDVQIFITDKETTGIASGPTYDGSGTRTIYRGYISLVERTISGGNEMITVHLLGYYTQLSLDILKNSTQTTLYSKVTVGLTTVIGDQSAADIGAMARAVIDRFIAETVSPKLYYVGGGGSSDDDIQDTGTTATYAFEQVSYRQALEQLKKMAPAGTYYYIDETGRVTFRSRSNSATHQFLFGRDFSEMHVAHNLEKMRNFLLVWNGEVGGAEIYKHYEDATSIALYGRRVETDNDYGVDNVNAADLIGVKFLAENAYPEVKVRATIIDSNNDEGVGYDIESIQPGDMCSMSGFSSSLSGIFRENMIITRVDYFLDRAEIEVQVVKSGLQDFQDKQGQDISKIQSGGLGVPDIYT